MARAMCKEKRGTKKQIIANEGCKQELIDINGHRQNPFLLAILYLAGCYFFVDYRIEGGTFFMLFLQVGMIEIAWA